MEPSDALLIGQEAGWGGVREGGLLCTVWGGDRGQSLHHLGGGETGSVMDLPCGVYVLC